MSQALSLPAVAKIVAEKGAGRLENRGHLGGQINLKIQTEKLPGSW